MTTPREFLSPRSIPPASWVAELRAVLERRRDIVAAYFVTTRYLLPPETVQDELHLELRDPPAAGAAPPALFRDLAGDLPSTPDGVIFTFAPKEILPRVRQAGAVLWSRPERS